MKGLTVVAPTTETPKRVNLYGYDVLLPQHLCRLSTSAVGMSMIEDRVLDVTEELGPPKDAGEAQAYVNIAGLPTSMLKMALALHQKRREA